jgi:transposase
VSQDMSAAYTKGVGETCRNAQVVFDKFHVIAHANKAVDEVRRGEVRLGGAGVREALRQSQWLWRKNPENLTQKEQARLAKIDQKSLRTAKARGYRSTVHLIAILYFVAGKLRLPQF